MSMYSMLNGRNPLTPILLHILDIDQEGGKWHSGRFRDVFLDAEGTKILLYTRNGGGNREHCGEGDAGPGCANYCCAIEHHLSKHPNYVTDYDDDFDCTYATVEFSVPEAHRNLARSLADGKEPKTIHQKFEEAHAAMSGMTKEQLEADPRFAPLVEMIKKMSDPDNDQRVFRV